MSSERVFDALTEKEAAIKADVDKYREHLWKEAREIIHERLPRKVLALNEFIVVRFARADFSMRARD